MANKIVLTNAGCKVDGTDLSTQVQSVNITYEAANQEVQSMSQDSVENLAGLLNWNFTVTFFQDFDNGASSVDATLFPKVGAAKFPVKIIVDKDSSPSATNPMFEGDAVLSSYPPLGQTIGDAVTSEGTFSSAGTLSRSTSGSF